MQNEEKNSKNVVDLILIGIGIAMGICTIVTSFLGSLEEKSGILMLGIGICSFGIYMLKNMKK